jgi:hypothetical protein
MLFLTHTEGHTCIPEVCQKNSNMNKILKHYTSRLLRDIGGEITNLQAERQVLTGLMEQKFATSRVSAEVEWRLLEVNEAIDTLRVYCDNIARSLDDVSG